MRETLIIKHAVGGKIFVDTAKHPLPYAVEEKADGSCCVTIQTEWNELVEELFELRHELNMFLFREYKDRPTVKTWFYVSEGPVEYNKEKRELSVTAASKIEYVPDNYLS
ncbi:hypothetical protein [Cohnella thailandensis]|uniref:Uncharacterized protein n=1 Tax=Cohnella thailandensis TaxID=557557 RepID=A0A841SVJ5_9BACL|nr:hypothetical protein [Cohnella thailandensis]MBB6634095.1 hypothetical protein [Cohnella thailandensis]MBP1972413.1 hypothetical protein [Cohnella thailandensis]